MTDVRDRETKAREDLADIGTPARPVPATRPNRPNRPRPGAKRDKKQNVEPVPAPRIDFPQDYEVEPERKFNVVLWSFIIFVLFPVFASGVYLFAIASDQYTAEMRFAVRNANGSPQTLDSSGSSTTTSSSSTSSSPSSSASILSTKSFDSQDAEIVASYIQSRAMIDEIARSVNIRAMFQRPEADFWARLPQDSSPEDLVRYWKKRVDVYIDTTSGIIQVKVTAFRREDALTLAQAILKASEDLVKVMSARIRTDLLNQAASEVRKSEGDVRNAMKELTAFRDSHELIDPTKTSDSTSQLLLQLMSSKIQTEAQLFVADRTGPNAPGIKAVRAQLASIDSHIDDLKQQLAGQKQAAKNMASTLAKFEELDLNRQFTERMLGYAQTGLEQARIAAMQQMIYLAVFVQPALPEDFTYPLRGTYLAIIALAVFLAWTTIATITASVLDHRL